LPALTGRQLALYDLLQPFLFGRLRGPCFFLIGSVSILPLFLFLKLAQGRIYVFERKVFGFLPLAYKPERFFESARQGTMLVDLDRALPGPMEGKERLPGLLALPLL
jgi:hypothetical protein